MRRGAAPPPEAPRADYGTGEICAILKVERGPRMSVSKAVGLASFYSAFYGVFVGALAVLV